MGWKGSNGKRGAAGKGTAAALAASCSLVFLAGWAWPREASSGSARLPPFRPGGLRDRPGRRRVPPARK